MHAIITITATNYSHYISPNKEIINKGVPQSARISKLEQISSQYSSQLVFAGEQLLLGTTRGVLFKPAVIW